jgi:hypothetical protein
MEAPTGDGASSRSLLCSDVSFHRRCMRRQVERRRPCIRPARRPRRSRKSTAATDSRRIAWKDGIAMSARIVDGSRPPGHSRTPTPDAARSATMSGQSRHAVSSAGEVSEARDARPCRLNREFATARARPQNAHLRTSAPRQPRANKRRSFGVNTAIGIVQWAREIAELRLRCLDVWPLLGLLPRIALRNVMS